MNPAIVGFAAFACALGGALCGMLGAIHLPQRHLSQESKETVKLGVGLIATMTALILGLVTASAKSSFDSVNTTVKHAAADVLALDRLLSRYGADETRQLRATLKEVFRHRIDTTWGERSRNQLAPTGESMRKAESLTTSLGQLEPRSEDQRWLKSRAVDLGESILGLRWALIASVGSSIPFLFVAILLFWISITFFSFGLFAPRNATVIAALIACALSVAAALVLVLELDTPFSGLIQIPQEPATYVLTLLGK